MQCKTQKQTLNKILQLYVTFKYHTRMNLLLQFYIHSGEFQNSPFRMETLQKNENVQYQNFFANSEYLPQ
jgi:hypothetical protein